MAINFLKNENASKSEEDDLYKSMRILMCIGRALGFLPITGIFQKNLYAVQVGHSYSFAKLYSNLVITCLAIYIVVYCIEFYNVGPRKTFEIVQKGSSLVFSGIGLCVCVFLSKRSNDLIHCLRKWSQLSPTIFYKDSNLQLHISLITGIIFSSAILENLSFHWKVIAVHGNLTYPWNPSNVKKSTSSIAETYWLVHHADLIPYNELLSIFLFIINKWCLYAWNFGDILIIIMARALYMRFLLCYQASKMALETQLQSPGMVIDDIHITSKSTHFVQQFWKQLATDHKTMICLFKLFREFLSPLIFFSVFANVYCVATSLYAFLVHSTPESKYNGIDLSQYLIWERVYETWAFLQLLGRMLATFICCAKVNQYAHHFLEILDECPDKFWTREIKRVDLSLRTMDIGFTGFGYFTITKRFILNVFNVIFTFEIVLLQSLNAK